MGQTIYWTPINISDHALSFNAPSSSRGIIERVFGAFPIRLTDVDIDRLRTLRQAFEHDANEYQELIDAIAEHGTIEINAA